MLAALKELNYFQEAHTYLPIRWRRELISSKCPFPARLWGLRKY